MEAIFLVCGAGGPQLKRDPLGGIPLPWPEKDVVTRVLAGVVGAVLGAGFGFGLWFSLVSFHLLPEAWLLACVIGAAALAAVLGAWRGDPMIRFLLRLIGG